MPGELCRQKQRRKHEEEDACNIKKAKRISALFLAMTLMSSQMSADVILAQETTTVETGSEAEDSETRTGNTATEPSDTETTETGTTETGTTETGTTEAESSETVSQKNNTVKMENIELSRNEVLSAAEPLQTAGNAPDTRSASYSSGVIQTVAMGCTVDSVTYSAQNLTPGQKYEAEITFAYSSNYAFDGIYLSDGTTSTKLTVTSQEMAGFSGSQITWAYTVEFTAPQLPASGALTLNVRCSISGSVTAKIEPAITVKADKDIYSPADTEIRVSADVTDKATNTALYDGTVQYSVNGEPIGEPVEYSLVSGFGATLPASEFQPGQNTVQADYSFEYSSIIWGNQTATVSASVKVTIAEEAAPTADSIKIDYQAETVSPSDPADELRYSWNDTYGDWDSDWTAFGSDGLDISEKTGSVLYIRRENSAVGEVAIPARPSVKQPKAVRITEDTVEFAEVSGCEYSLDGKTWQDSPVFTGQSVKANESFTLYQRLKATDTSFASEVKEAAAMLGTQYDLSLQQKEASNLSISLVEKASGTPLKENKVTAGTEYDLTITYTAPSDPDLKFSAIMFNVDLINDPGMVLVDG